MKKYILGGIALIVVVIVTIVNVNINSRNSNLSDIFSVNVKALSNESGATVTCEADPLDTCTISTGDKLQDQDERD
jgi:hypothetical protein